MSGTLASAELIDDRGEAATSEDFFRSRPFLDAEGVTHTLRIESGDAELLTPLIVRDIPPRSQLSSDNDEKCERSQRDATSPYGYPGLSIAASDLDHNRGGSISDALDPAAVDFAATGLVSVFLRHTLAEPSPLGGARERNVVQIADPALPRKSRPSDRNQVNKNRRAGYEVLLVDGTETSAEQRRGFLAAYEQTMRRAGAGERYFFGASYFDRILAAAGTTLALVLAPGGEVAAASIAARSDGYLHYYLSGSADSHLRDSPMKNAVAALVDLAAELSLPLNLGGGISPGDPLEEFKRGFANREQAWRTSEIVCDPAAYERLTTGRDASGYFPAYRAPI